MIEIRPTVEADLPALDRLFREAFDHPLDPAVWSWKYRRTPGEARSLVAVDPDGEALAHAGALALPARWRERRGLLWQLADFAGSARGRGLRPPLVDLGRELLDDLPRASDLPWIFGFPSGRHFRLGQRLFGYRPVTEIVPLSGRLSEVAREMSGAGEEQLREMAEPGHSVALDVLGSDSPGSGPVTDDGTGDWTAASWNACGVDGVERSAGFLNWRYHDRPDRYYRFYRLRSEAPVSGLAVFAFVGTEARAAELWLPPGGDWYDALTAVAVDLVAAGLETWRFWPPPGSSDDAGAALARVGVTPRPEEAVFLGCRGPGERPEAAAADVYYAMGDYDAV